MKILFKTLALSAVVILASCSKDDNDDDNNSNNNNSVTLSSVIEGEWEVTSIRQKNGENTLQGQTVNTFTGEGRDFEGSITFNGDGTTIVDIGYVMDITMNIQGSTQTQSVPVPRSQSNGSYQVLSNTKIAASDFGNSGGSQEYNVSNVTSSSMKWSKAVSQTDSISGAAASFDLEIEFEKL